MNNLKDYANLNELFGRNQKKRLIGLAVMFLIVLFGFFSFILDIPFGISMTCILFIIPTIAMGIVCLVMKFITKKSLSRFTPDELARINNDIMSVQVLDGYSVTQDAVICAKQKLFLYPVKNVIWVYKHVTTTSMYGVIPVSKQSCVMIAGKDHKRYSCKMKNKSEVVEFLQAGLSQYRKEIFYGYGPDLDEMFRKNFERMVAISEQSENQINA